MMTPYSWTPTRDTCRFNFDTSMEFVTDNLKNVQVLQTTTGSADIICGTTEFMYNHINDDKNTTWSNVMTHSWSKVAAATTTQSFMTYFKFSNFPQFIIPDGGV